METIIERILITRFSYKQKMMVMKRKNSIPFSIIAKALIIAATTMVSSCQKGIFGYCQKATTTIT